MEDVQSLDKNMKWVLVQTDVSQFTTPFYKIIFTIMEGVCVLIQDQYLEQMWISIWCAFQKMIRMREATSFLCCCAFLLFIHADTFASFSLWKNHKPWKGLAKILCPWSPLVVTFRHYPTSHLSTGQISLIFLIRQQITSTARTHVIVFTVQHLGLFLKRVTLAVTAWIYKTVLWQQFSDTLWDQSFPVAMLVWSKIQKQGTHSHQNSMKQCASFQVL